MAEWNLDHIYVPGNEAELQRMPEGILKSEYMLARAEEYQNLINAKMYEWVLSEFC